jgi:hypothetical protein
MSSLFTVNTYCLIDENDNYVLSLYSEHLLSDW